MAGALVPEDDLYARLEVGVDASPEAIELAWRALLKQHHPDVAGDDARRARPGQADQRRPRLAERPGAARALRPRAARPRRGPRRPRADRGPPRPAAARLAAAAGAAARPPPGRGARRARTSSGAIRPSAWIGSSTGSRGCRPTSSTGSPRPSRRRSRSWRRSAASSRPRRRRRSRTSSSRSPPRVPHERWAEVGLREGLLGVAAELVLVAVPRRHARGAVPRPRARPAAARLGGVDRPAALRAQRGRGRSRSRDRVRVMTPRRGRRARPRLDRRAGRRPAVAAGARPRRGRGAADLRAARGARRRRPRCRPTAWRRRRRPGRGACSRGRATWSRCGTRSRPRRMRCWSRRSRPRRRPAAGSVARRRPASAGLARRGPRGPAAGGTGRREPQIRATDVAGELAEPGDGLRPERVPDPGPASLAADPAGVAQDLEVVRHGRLADVAAGVEVAGADLVGIAQLAQDREPGRIGRGLEQEDIGVGVALHSGRLY